MLKVVGDANANNNSAHLANQNSQADNDLHVGPTFDDFWTLYPRRVARKAASRAWERLSPADQAEAIVALADWRQIWQARNEPEFTPHASTWLNGERWADELPRDFRRPPVGQQSAAAESATPRTAIPEHVRALLAKLRGK